MPETKPHGISVAPSPFNPVKRDVILIAVGGFILWMLLDWFMLESWKLAVLAGYGLAGFCRLALCTHAIMHDHLKKNG